MKPRDIKPGVKIAYVGRSSDARCEEDIALEPGDVVEVVALEPEDDCATVLVLRGRLVGKVGQIHVDLDVAEARAWRRLTLSGSMASRR